jgi:hypothetical protein
MIMTLSLRSDALEPTRPELASLSFGERLRRYLPVYGLPIIGLLLIILFSAIFPHTFPTLANVSAMIDNKAIIALLSLAVLAPMAAGKIDLTIGFGIVLWHILVISLQLNYNIPWELAVVIVLACGGALGLINALLVEFAQIDAFVATLGTGTVTYAIALWYTGGQQVVGVLPDGFDAIDGTHILGLPISTLYVLGLSVCLWLAFEYLPIGRFIYAIGANPRAAALNGIPVGSCSPRSCRSVRRASGWTSCYRRSSAFFSVRRRSSRGASMYGERWSESLCWPSAFLEYSSSAPTSMWSRCSTASRSSGLSASQAMPSASARGARREKCEARSCILSLRSH